MPWNGIRKDMCVMCHPYVARMIDTLQQACGSVDLGSTGTFKGSNVAVSGHFFRFVKIICHYCRETLTYDVFGPIILDYAPGEFVCWHFCAWRRGRILIMPADTPTV